MPSPAASRPPHDRSVFINCPFDSMYRPLLRAMCFTIVACGYLPRCALDYSDSAAVRFEKILDLICACDLSIHDVSRVELDMTSADASSGAHKDLPPPMLQAARTETLGADALGAGSE
ncbi:MAG: hypothetical protein ACREEX_08385, partial [Caulobacteraceae bacterium]